MELLLPGVGGRGGWWIGWNPLACIVVAVFLVGRCMQSVPVSSLRGHGLGRGCLLFGVAFVSGSTHLARWCQNRPAKLQRSRQHWVSARTAWLLLSRLCVVLSKLLVVAIEWCPKSRGILKQTIRHLLCPWRWEFWVGTYMSLLPAESALWGLLYEYAHLRHVVSGLLPWSRTMRSHRCHHCCGLHKS